jgi:hypothetical protein
MGKVATLSFLLGVYIATIKWYVGPIQTKEKDSELSSMQKVLGFLRKLKGYLMWKK